MILRLYHGRLRPDTGGTDIDGNECDDWGFEGPVLEGIDRLDYTYGNVDIIFRSEKDAATAKYLTGWESGVHENSLRMNESDEYVYTWSGERKRSEYFGDYLLTEG